MAVLATAVWRVRPSGNNLNGGGYDTGIAGHATDYSQQNSAQASGSNATCAVGTTTFVDATANAFTSAMIGNAIWIASGTNFVVSAYFVTAFTSASTVTLDRTPSPTLSGSAGVWKLGGGWADFWTNTTTAAAVLVQNNTVFILGSGTPNPASYTYDYVAGTALTAGAGVEAVVFANDPSTPGYKAPPDTTGGMPVIQWHLASDLFASTANTLILQGLYFVGSSTNVAGTNLLYTNARLTVLGCVFDQFGQDVLFVFSNGGGGINLFGCEGFSSVTPGANGSNGIVDVDVSSTGVLTVVSCNIHDTVGKGVTLGSGGIGTVLSSIISKCRGAGVSLNSGNLFYTVANCTIDGNLGDGIFSTVSRRSLIWNNIISNHTAGGTFGLNFGATGSPPFVDYNVFYNNTTDLNNGSYGPHDTHGGSNPYVGQQTENYTLA